MTTRRGFLGATAALGGLAAAGLPGLAFGQDSRSGAGGAPAIQPGAHELLPLPYGYDALEPHIDAETMALHHDKHHAAYVKGLNAAELALVEARKGGDYADLAALEQQLAFHGNGHSNHTVFWNNMAPAGSGPAGPGGELATLIERDFGGADAFRAQFQAAAGKIEGNGWGALVYHPGFGRLYVSAILNHQNYVLAGSIPLLLCDVWEHAYYLKYRNLRNDYLTAWWNVVNWADVEKRLSAARRSAP
jgi:Fe-Mn family superoxide dismutase